MRNGLQFAVEKKFGRENRAGKVWGFRSQLGKGEKFVYAEINRHGDFM